MTTLDELAIALRAESPRPDPAFEQRLDARVAAGFPRKRRLELPHLSPPVLGAVAAALVAIVVGVSLIGRGGSSSSNLASGGQVAAEKAPATHAPDLQASGGSAATAAAPRAVAPVATPRRHVERSASLTLAAARNRLEAVANEVVAVVDRHRGYVLHSTVSAGDSAYFDLRIPAGELQPALRDLSALADVRSRSQSLNDITQPYNSTADALATQRALRQSLLKQLAAATTDTQAQALRSRLRLVSARIRTLSGELGALRQRANYSSVSVTLERRRGHISQGASGIGGDFHDALHSLAVSFGIALRILGVAIPLMLIGGLAWLGTALLRRRRREAALL
jgi:hypothetical protein